MTTAIENPKAYRLPHSVLPRRYDIELDARVGRPTCIGKVAIHVDIRELTTAIELHADELLTLNQAVLSVGDQTLQGQITQDPEAGNGPTSSSTVPSPPATPCSQSPTTAKSAPLSRVYTAPRTAPNRSSAPSAKRPTAARFIPAGTSLPSRPTFAWTVTTDPQNTVLCQRPPRLHRDSPDGKSKTWTFAPTKLMSTYLCAVLIGEIEGTPEEIVNGTPIRVLGHARQSGNGPLRPRLHEAPPPLVRETTSRPPTITTSTIRQPCPASHAGAMENVGLVLYRASLPSS